MPIELILKAIDQVVRLLERRERVSRDRLDKIYSPIFKDLTSIDQDYIEMFSQVRNKFPMPLEAKMPGYSARVTEACESLVIMRVKFASTRDKIAALAGALHGLDDLQDAEKAFVDAVVQYLPTGELSVHGVSAARDGTKATVLIDDLYKNMQSPSFDARSRIDETISANRSLWREVCRAYSKLSVETIR